MDGCEPYLCGRGCRLLHLQRTRLGVPRSNALSRLVVQQSSEIEVGTDQGPILVSRALLPSSLTERARIYAGQIDPDNKTQSTGQNQQPFSFFGNANLFPFEIGQRSMQAVYTALSPALPHSTANTTPGVTRRMNSNTPHISVAPTFCGRVVLCDTWDSVSRTDIGRAIRAPIPFHH